jgi:hypothetical protein
MSSTDGLDMSPITELATLSLKPGINVEDQSSPEGQIALESLSTISSQPGFERLYYGPVLEDASAFQLFIGAYSHDIQGKLPLPSATAP